MANGAVQWNRCKSKYVLKSVCRPIDFCVVRQTFFSRLPEESHYSYGKQFSFGMRQLLQYFSYLVDMQNQKAKCICSKIYMRKRRKRTRKITVTKKPEKKRKIHELLSLLLFSFFSMNVRSPHHIALQCIELVVFTNFAII